MSKPVHNVNTSAAIPAVSTEGMEALFQGKNSVSAPSHKVWAQSRGLTIKEAAEHYRLSENSIRMKIKLGDIAALKVDGRRGPQWLVFPEGIPTSTVSERDDQATNTVPTPPEALQHPETITLPGPSQYPVEMTDEDVVVEAIAVVREQMVTWLQEQLEHKDSQLSHLNKELAGANHRNGFLESENARLQSDFKLLTDSQHDKNRKWWHWLFGTKK